MRTSEKPMCDKKHPEFATERPHVEPLTDAEKTAISRLNIYSKDDGVLIMLIDRLALATDLTGYDPYTGETIPAGVTLREWRERNA